MAATTFDHYMDALKGAAGDLATFDSDAAIAKDWRGMPVVISPKSKTVFFLSNSDKDGGKPVGDQFTWTLRKTVKTGQVYVRSQKCDTCDTYDAGYQQYTPSRLGDKPVNVDSSVLKTDDTVVHTTNVASTTDGCYAAWHVNRGIVIAKAVSYQSSYTRGSNQDLSDWLG